MEWIKENLLWIATSVVLPLITWFVHGKYRQRQELKSQKIQNEGSTSSVVGQNLELYQRMLDDYTQRKDKELQEAYERIEKLKVRIEFLEDENTKLKNRIVELET